LLQVTDAAVNQLGAAAGSSFAEVALLQQEHVVAAGGAINRHTGSGGASAYHDHVPRAGMRLQPAVHLSAVHWSYQFYSPVSRILRAKQQGCAFLEADSRDGCTATGAVFDFLRWDASVPNQNT